MSSTCDDDAVAQPVPARGGGKGKAPPPPGKGKGKAANGNAIPGESVQNSTTSAGKGKGAGSAPPLPAKGDGKPVVNVKVPKPSASRSLEMLGELQLADGSWALGPTLAIAFGVVPSDLEAILREAALPNIDGGQTWEQVMATAASRQAIQRCATIAASEMDISAGADQRKKALAIAEAKSPLGDAALCSAEQWLERAWAVAVTAVGPRLEMKRVRLEGRISKLLDKQFPRPDWKKALSAKKNVQVKCQECGTEFSAAVSKCPTCSPPEAPKLERLTSVELLQQWRRLPPAPVDPSMLNFPGVKGMMHLGGGSGGVTLLHLPEGVICLKPQMMNAAAELFARHVAECLGTRVAKTHVISMADDTFMQIKQAMRSAPEALEEHRALARRHHGRTEFIGLLEFVPGFSLQGLEVHDLLQRMSPATLNDFWSKVGRVIAYDAVINNVDRIPLLWDNEGNTANLMLQLGSDGHISLIGIDQAITPIVEQGPGRARYLERLRKLVDAIVSESWQSDTVENVLGQWSVSAGLGRVQEAFRVSCGTDVDQKALMHGLRAGLEQIAEKWESGLLLEALKNAAADVGRAFASASVDTGTRQLPTMLDFVSATSATVAQGVAAAISA